MGNATSDDDVLDLWPLITTVCVLSRSKDENHDNATPYICCGEGCHLASRCVSIILYAVDIHLLLPSVTSLQSMFNICDDELHSLNVYINPSKSACMSIGPRCKQAYLCITTNDGMPIPCYDTCRYLGVYLACATKIQVNFDHAKSNFYRAFNGIMANVDRSASHDVMVQLLRSKCLPILLYGTAACNLVNKLAKSLDYVITCAVLKNIFLQQHKSHYRL